jgi:hypothetical protein
MSAKKLLAVLAALLLIMAACGDDDEASSTNPSVSEEASTPQLTFDGTACTYAGPAEVTAGGVVVELTNTSDDGAAIGVFKIDEGYTADDLAEYLDDPANLAGGAEPEWVISEETGFPRAGTGETIAWDGSLDAGEYVLTCVNNRLFVSSPWVEGAVTVGSGLTVVEG